ncbi:radical SAM protein [Thermoplasmatales archaeon ex4484_30]|nr:MAG: radical SAM protein [Thermoplasmatales archaeon ex4484_30]
MDPKILFTTVYRNKGRHDYFEANSRNTVFRFSIPRIRSLGLRFIKQNIPEIEILEYPTWEEYKKAIKKQHWDIVGFSFYVDEIPEILQMIKYARENGVEEIWGGNYGALTEEIEEYFDWICIGYGEEEIAKKLGIKIKEVVHPPLIGHLGTPIGLKLTPSGFLFTSRGCNRKCIFCQTPAFCRKPSKIPISSIEKVLLYYKSIGVDQLVMPEENFGMFKSHMEKVVELLGEYGFYWYPVTRADTLNENLSFWMENGLNGAGIGIETFSQKTMDEIEKKEKVEEVIEAVKNMQKFNRFIYGTYMIGYEDDTKESIKKSIIELAKLKLDLTQICVLMPLPRTPLWDYIQEKYGIFEKDWHKFNTKHLVWNHPHISPKEMEDLLTWAFKKVYPRTTPLRTTLKFMKRYSEAQGGVLKGPLYMLKQFIQANTFEYCKDEYV